MKQFADFFSKKFGGCLDCQKKCLAPKKIGFDYLISRTFFSCFCPYSKKTQTTQTRAFARAARRSRSFHSRAAPAAALELLLGNLNNQLNQLKSQISDHKAAAGAVRRRRKRLVAAGCKPASVWSAFFSKVSKAGRKLQSFIHRITILTTPLTCCKTYTPIV